MNTENQNELAIETPKSNESELQINVHNDDFVNTNRITNSEKADSNQSLLEPNVIKARKYRLNK